MSFFRRFLGGGIAASDEPLSGTAHPESWLTNLLGGIATATGLRISASDAMAVPAVAACIQVLSEDVAKVPLRLFRRLDGGAKEPARDHPLYWLTHDRPAPWLTSFHWRRGMIEVACQHGNAFSRVIRDASGRVRRIVPLAPGSTTIRWAEDGEPFFDVADRQGGFVAQGLTHQDIIHLPYRAGFGRAERGGVAGQSPLSMHKEAVALAIATERFGAKFFANAARPSMLLHTDGKVGPEVEAQIRDSFERAYSGVDNAFRVAVLQLGLKAQQLSANNEDSQFMEAREFQAEEMARIFRVPPHKIGLMRRSTFANIEHQGLEYVTDTLSTIAKNLESSLSMSLLTENEQRDFFFELNLDGLLRGDIQSRYRAYAIGRQWGWLNVDEIRDLENRNPLPDGEGEAYLEPLNMKPVGEPDPSRDDDDDDEERRNGAALPSSILGRDGAPLMNGVRLNGQRQHH